MNRTEKVLIGGLGLVLVIVACGLGALIYQSFQPPPPPSAPLEYTQHSYPAERVQLRPGDHLRYSPQLIVRQSGKIEVFRSYWSVDKSADAVLCSGVPAPTDKIERNRPKGIVGNIRGGRVVDVPIPTLPNGKYLYLTSVSGPGRGQSDYEVPFEVVGSIC